MIFTQQEKRKIIQLPVTRLVPNPHQPRKVFSREELEGLARSIAVNGLLQPISVRKSGEDFEIIAGERRWRACMLAGLKSVPCLVHECSDAQSAVLAILELFGVPVAGLLAGAGVAGLAVSLAAQSTLSNLIAGITLVLEHPFGIGDYVILGSSEGTVEDISFRSTRIRTTDNVAVTIENSKVCSEYIQNCNQRSSRLWQFTLGLTYDTTREQLNKICHDLAQMLKEQPTVRADTVTVTVDKFNDYSIDVLVRLYVTTLPYGEFLEEKSRLNLKIMQLVADAGCSFAFPTTTLDMPAQK